jgi:AcrR family transcriptional regulator
MATQAERRASTREAILNAAQRLFEKHGFEETAVEDITGAANVAKGTFYQHFASKTAIATALMRRYQGESLAGLERRLAGGGRPLEIGRLLVRGLAQACERHRTIVRQMLAVELKHPAKPEEPSTRAVFARVLRGAQLAEDIRSDVDVDDLALMFVGGIAVLIIRWTECGKRGDLLPLLERAWRTFLEGARRIPKGHST